MCMWASRISSPVRAWEHLTGAEDMPWQENTHDRRHEVVIVSTHALERYKLHHPRAGWSTVRKAFQTGVPIDPWTGRHLRGPDYMEEDTSGDYIVAPDRRGVFIYVNEPAADDPGTLISFIVTYLRFQQQQETFAWKSWPPRANSKDKLPDRLTGRDETGEVPMLRLNPNIESPLVALPLSLVKASSKLHNILGARDAVEEALKRSISVDHYSNIYHLYALRPTGERRVVVVRVVLGEDGWKAEVHRDCKNFPLRHTREHVYDSVPFFLATPLRDVRISERLRDLCGGNSLARRYLYFGQYEGMDAGGLGKKHRWDGHRLKIFLLGEEEDALESYQVRYSHWVHQNFPSEWWAHLEDDRSWHPSNESD